MTSRETPNLTLQFGDIENRKEFGSKVTLKSLILSPLLPVDLIKPKPKVNSLGLDFDYLDILVNKQYYDELINYIFEKNALNSIGFVIENKSSEVASGVQLKANINFQEGLCFCDEAHSARFPQRNGLPNVNIGSNIQRQFLNLPYPSIEKYNNHWELNVNFGDVLPGSKVWTTTPIYIGGGIALDVKFDVMIYARNLPEPVRMPVSVEIEAETRPMELRDVKHFLGKDK